MQSYILVVEDDEHVAVAIKDVLVANGYGFLYCNNRIDTLKIIKEQQVDLVVLDVSLGQDNGFDLCREIRICSAVPVIFLTASDSENEIIRGFSVGSDDYVTKPFRLTELMARIGAILRRHNKEEHKLISGDLIYDEVSHVLTCKGYTVPLGKLESQIVSMLIQSYPKVLTRDMFFHQVWDGDERFVENNTLTVLINRLRDKLEKDSDYSYIETIRRVGYRWNVEVVRRE